MKILIADDHQLFRRGLKSLIRKFDFVSKVREAENGREVIETLRTEMYDVIFMDISMPLMNGTDATKIVKRDFPAVKVIALSMYEDQKHVIEMMESGASGYILKNTNEGEIKTALLKIAGGELYFTRQLSEALINSLIHKHNLRKNEFFGLISCREKEILDLICQEYTTKQIAESLFLSEKTVEWHRLNLLQKTNSKNIVGVVLFALKHDIIQQPV
jgi:DNA-binding NarL/FixJ family response regulator